MIFTFDIGQKNIGFGITIKNRHKTLDINQILN